MLLKKLVVGLGPFRVIFGWTRFMPGSKIRSITVVCTTTQLSIALALLFAQQFPPIAHNFTWCSFARWLYSCSLIWIITDATIWIIGFSLIHRAHEHARNRPVGIHFTLNRLGYAVFRVGFSGLRSHQLSTEHCESAHKLPVSTRVSDCTWWGEWHRCYENWLLRLQMKQ